MLAFITELAIAFWVGMVATTLVQRTMNPRGSARSALPALPVIPAQVASMPQQVDPVTTPYRSPAVVSPQPERIYEAAWTYETGDDEFKEWVKKLPRVDPNNYLLSVDVTQVLRALYEQNKLLKARLEKVEDRNHRGGYRGSPPDPNNYPMIEDD